MNVHSIINVVLLASLLIYPTILQLNKRVYHGKNQTIIKLIKAGKKVHPLIGLLLILSGSIHGYLKLNGNLQFHTGSLVIISLLITGLLGWLNKRNYQKAYSRMHKLMGFIVLLVFALHYFNPWYFL